MQTTFRKILDLFEYRQKCTEIFANGPLCTSLWTEFIAAAEDCPEFRTNQRMPESDAKTFNCGPIVRGKRPIDVAVNYMHEWIVGRARFSDMVLAMYAVYRPEPNKVLRAKKIACKIAATDPSSIIPLAGGYARICDDQIVGTFCQNSKCDLAIPDLSVCSDYCVNSRGIFALSLYDGLHVKFGGLSAVICTDQHEIVAITNHNLFYTRYEIMYQVDLRSIYAATTITITPELVFLYEMWDICIRKTTQMVANGELVPVNLETEHKIYFESVRGGTWIRCDDFTAVVRYKIVGKFFPLCDSLLHFDDSSRQIKNADRVKKTTNNISGYDDKIAIIDISALLNKIM